VTRAMRALREADKIDMVDGYVLLKTPHDG